MLSKLDVSHNPLLKNLNHSNNYMEQPDHAVRGVGTFVWNNNLSCYECTLYKNGKELFISVEVETKATMINIASQVKKIIDNLDMLNDKICHQVKKEYPNANKSNMTLEVLNIYKDKSFQLGCNAGDSPAGHLYLYQNFDKKFELDKEIISETY